VTPTAVAPSGGLFSWWGEGTPAARRALIAAGLGWALDAFDVMLYALVLASVIGDLHLTKQQAGMLGSVALLSAAGGGIVFGMIADRYGRTKALMGSVLIYSVATALCGTATNLWQFAAFRILLGLGMGGEWASGAALVSETWPVHHRGKALGLMQSAWAIGYGTAALVVKFVLPAYGWRAVFFVGILPALLVLWVRRNVEEPELWRARAGQRDAERVASKGRSAFAEIFSGPIARTTIAVTLMNACTLFGWWGLNSWIPAYLSLPTTQGGIGLSTGTMSNLVLTMQVGMWFGYVTFGYVGDAIGRKRAYVMYLLCASVLLLALGPLVAFFGTGYYSGFGAVTAELYPTRIRATAQGFTYNLGRIASAAAPFTVGSLAATQGFAIAFTITGAAFLLAAVAWVWIPETQGRELA